MIHFYRNKIDKKLYLIMRYLCVLKKKVESLTLLNVFPFCHYVNMSRPDS